MRKKWIIIATTVLLGVVCGVLILNKKIHYSSVDVKTEISNHGKDFIYFNFGHGPRISSSITGSHTSVYQRVIDWYQTFLANQKTTSTEYIYSKSESELCLITLYEKNNQIYEVKIEYQTGSMQDALDLQSVLSKAFPDLPCKITGSK